MENSMDKTLPPPLTYSRPIVPEYHLSDYLEILYRRRWIVIITFAIIVGSVTAFSLFATPQYQATAQILLGGQPSPMNPLGESSDRLPERNLYFQTQVNLLSSRSLSRKVIEELSLDKVLAENAKPNPFLAFASFKPFQSDKKENDPALPSDIQEIPSLSQTIDWYLKRLSVVPVQNSSLVQIGFSGPDAGLITQIVNTHAESAIQDTIHQHQSQAKDALDWLRSQIDQQKKDVERSQYAIYEFKKKYNVLSLDDSQISFSQNLQELNTALTKAKSERIAKQAVYLQLQDIIKSKKNILLMPEISNYSVIQNLRNQLIDLKSKQIEMGTKYGHKHPKIQVIDNGIRQIENEITLECGRLKNAIKADLDRAVAIENNVRNTLDNQKQIAMHLGERAIEYEVLKQQAKSSQDIYDFLLKQSEELGLSSAIRSSNMRFVDRAELPIKPISPKLLLNILVSILLAFFTGTGLAFFIEYLDNTVKTPTDVSNKLGLPVLGMIPFHNALQKDQVSVSLLESSPGRNQDALPPPIYHISNRLPDELRSYAQGLFGRVLIVESVTMSEGKSTVITRIAANLTEAGLRVLLVDCDFQRPSLDKLCKVPAQGGLGKSINRIMSHRLHSGTLTEYSMDDLFFLIALKKMSGNLIVKNDEQTFIAHFQNGVLMHIQNRNAPKSNRIGSVLLKGGFITEDQLNDALSRNQRTGQPLGYILVNTGIIGREKLRGPLRLQIEEYLQKMFSWKNGDFLFNPALFHIYENEKIFFEEDFSAMINTLGRIENSKFVEKELFSQIVDLSQDNLSLLPAGTSQKLIGALNQFLMKKIFEKLRQRFDVILVDTPPLDAASGIESIFQLADGMVVVIKAGHLSVNILNGAINHLPQDKIIGTVLNQVKVKAHHHYYY
jgi:succinoglycan biosynthesis transport protein ExoP